MWTILWAASGAFAADLAAGEPIEQAISIQVGSEGLDTVAGLVPALLPTDALAVDDTSASTGLPAFCLGYSYEISNIVADMTVNDVQITPLPGELQLDVWLTVALNDPANPFTIILDAICLIDENCTGWIDPFNLFVSAPVTFAVVGAPGSRTLDAVVGDLVITHDLDASYLHTGCLLDDIESVLNIFGLSIFDLMVNLFSGQITDMIEPALDEALAQTNIQGELDLLGATMAYAIEPSAAIHTAQGLQLELAAQFDAEQAACVADDDPGSSYATFGAVPDPAANPIGSHVAIHASQDMIDQALYAAWRGGGLCMSIGAAGGLDLGGLALDTSMLGLIGGDEFNDLFPDPKPIEILMRPHAAPLATLTGAEDLALDLDELELVFMGELDGRMARAIGVGVNATIGVNVPFDPTTGELSVDIAVDSDAITAHLSGDPLTSTVADKIETGFPAVMATLLEQMLPSLVGDTLAFALPTFEGLGLVSLDIEASGAGQDWLGAYAEIGDAPYADPYASGCGCGGTTSTSTGGCGCDTAAPRIAPIGWLIGLALLRRRRR